MEMTGWCCFSQARRSLRLLSVFEKKVRESGLFSATKSIEST
jgi:hypothetical protein